MQFTWALCPFWGFPISLRKCSLKKEQEEDISKLVLKLIHLDWQTFGWDETHHFLCFEHCFNQINQGTIIYVTFSNSLIRGS